jgi:hypothetical protein
MKKTGFVYLRQSLDDLDRILMQHESPTPACDQVGQERR